MHLISIYGDYKMLKKLKSQDYKKNILLNNINDYVIRIDYYDDNGYERKKYNVPLKYVFNNNNNSISSNHYQISIN